MYFVPLASFLAVFVQIQDRRSGIGFWWMRALESWGVVGFSITSGKEGWFFEVEGVWEGEGCGRESLSVVWTAMSNVGVSVNGVDAECCLHCRSVQEMGL